MTETTKRLPGQGQIADALRRALPAKRTARTEKILLALSPEERARLVSYAEETGEPLAVAARNLILAALTTLGK